MIKLENTTSPLWYRRWQELHNGTNTLLNVIAYILPGLTINSFAFVVFGTDGRLWLGMDKWMIFKCGLVLIPLAGICISLRVRFLDSSRNWSAAAACALIAWLPMLFFAILFIVDDRFGGSPVP